MLPVLTPRLPGRAWLQFEVTPADDGPGAVIHQTAEFDPAGLGELVYWYAVWPAHATVFRGMIRRIEKAARQSNAEQDSVWAVALTAESLTRRKYLVPGR